MAVSYEEIELDIETVQKIPAVPTILEVVCRTTGMGFAAVARVTENRWVACSVLDEIEFGLKPGGELAVETTICQEVRFRREVIAIDHVAGDDVWRDHHTPALYGFQSYISVPIVLADGTFFGTLCAIDPRPARLNRPEIIGMFRLFADLIGKHLNTQTKLARTESALTLAQNVIESNSDCVKVLDLAGRVLSINQKGCGLMEVDSIASIRSLEWLGFWEGLEREKAASAFLAAVAGTQTRFEGVCKTLKGQSKSWDVTLIPIMEHEGKASNILVISRDLTARRAEESHLLETAKLESLGVLAGGIAHDFNNLLTGMLGGASLIEMSSNREDAALATEIVKAAERAADLTRQLLAYSGRGRFLVKGLNLSVVVEEILQLIKTTIDKKVEIVFSLDRDLPLVFADPVQMQQLIMNLIINGSEAMEGKEGKLLISTTVVEIDSAFLAKTFRLNEPALTLGRYVALEVRDTGSGMSETTLSRIFDPFFTTKFTGRGLGLAAVSGILRSHRGAVRVYSELGNGTTFKVFLPVVEDSWDAPLQDPTRSVTYLRDGWGAILFVDDEETVRKIAQRALQRSGFEVVLANDGKQAIDRMRESPDRFRLVVLDLTMPVMDGGEALAVLRSIKPGIPVLVSSGYNQADIVRRFTNQDVSGFIQKPYTAEMLTEGVRLALHSKEQATQEASG